MMKRVVCPKSVNVRGEEQPVIRAHEQWVASAGTAGVGPGLDCTPQLDRVEAAQGNGGPRRQLRRFDERPSAQAEDNKCPQLPAEEPPGAPASQLTN